MQKGDLIRGKYRLVRLLGDGGMGSVFEALHEGLGTRVAIKVLHPDLARRAGLVERFLREARVSAQIKSANVVQVMDVERTDDDVAYIVMELLEGEPLSSALEREKKLGVGVACDYVVQILRALEAAHALGVVHRDLKPENVFVTFVAGKPLLKLIDFGIAKARQMDSQSKNLTVAGVVMGTPEYMAPEQAQSADKADARSDLYAVGVMLYEMISGTRPVVGDDARVVALKVQRGEVRPLVHAAPGVPPDLAGIVHRAMAPLAELRFSSATELRLALEASASGKRTAAPATAAVATTEPPSASAGLGAYADGTVMGAPAEGTVRDGSRTSIAVGGVLSPGTYRPPPGDYGSAWQAGAPGASPLPGPAQGPARMASGYEARARPSRRGSSVWLLIALPVLLGAGIVVAFALHGSSGGGPSPAISPASPPVSVASIPASAAPAPSPSPPDSTATVAPLLPATPMPRPSPAATGSGAPAKPHPSGSSSATPPPGDIPSPFPFPSGFPGLPNPFPSSSDGGTIFTIPTSLPTTLPFPFPGAETPAPSSQPPPKGKAM